MLESGFETSDNKRKMPYKLLTCKLAPKCPYLAAELEAELQPWDCCLWCRAEVCRGKE